MFKVISNQSEDASSAPILRAPAELLSELGAILMTLACEPVANLPMEAVAGLKTGLKVKWPVRWHALAKRMENNQKD